MRAYALRGEGYYLASVLVYGGVALFSVVAVVNDSVGSTKVSVVKKVFPDRVVNVGIAEQDAVASAAGLASLAQARAPTPVAPPSAAPSAASFAISASQKAGLEPPL